MSMETTKTEKYGSLREFVVMNRVMLPKPTETWRLVKDMPVGSINGLPTCSGVAVATNGIIVAIERSDRSILFCHLDWFSPDKNMGEIKMLKEKASTTTTKKKESSFASSLMDFGM